MIFCCVILISCSSSDSVISLLCNDDYEGCLCFHLVTVSYLQGLEACVDYEVTVTPVSPSGVLGSLTYDLARTVDYREFP